MIIDENMRRTTIVVDSSTRDKLKQFGVKGETYEEIILRLMKFYDSNTKGRSKEMRLWLMEAIGLAKKTMNKLKRKTVAKDSRFYKQD